MELTCTGRQLSSTGEHRADLSDDTPFVTIDPEQSNDPAFTRALPAPPVLPSMPIDGTSAPFFESESASCAPTPSALWHDVRDLTIDPRDGTVRHRIRFPIPEGRGGFGPEVALDYRMDEGNGAFGCGWDVRLPSIRRSCWPEVPRYGDDAVVDSRQVTDVATYELHDWKGSVRPDRLVPAMRKTGSWVDDRTAVGDYVVTRFRRQQHLERERIEQWHHQPTGTVHWRITDEANVTTTFGTESQHKLADPDDESRVGAWLIAETYDDKGNVICYEHKEEPSEAQRYLKRVLYVNDAPFDRTKWHIEVLFDYGEHAGDAPTYLETSEWNERDDTSVTRRFGFALHTRRRCERVLVFHRFGELGEDPVLTQFFAFDYDVIDGQSFLRSVGRQGVIGDAKHEMLCTAAPALSFSYSHSATRAFDVHELAEPLVGALLSDPKRRARWVDLYGEGLPGMVFSDNQTRLYVRNLGNGRFDSPEVLADDVFLQDAETREVIDLSADARFGAIAHRRDLGSSAVLQGTDPNVDRDATVSHLDVNGDNEADVVVADDGGLRWYPSTGDRGFDDPVVLRFPARAPLRPRRLRIDERQTCFVADMTGDGIIDLVRLRSGELTYWPGLGHGNFGEPVIMQDAPEFAHDNLSNAHVLFCDMTGTGACDVVWIDEGEVHLWKNIGGVRFEAPLRCRADGISPRQQNIAAVDLYGTGRDCIVWAERSLLSQKNAVVKVLGFSGQAPVGMLVGAQNELGGSTSITFHSLAHLFANARRNGDDQLMLIPSPRFVAVSVRNADEVTGTTHERTLNYRHPMYDTSQRRFLGFCFTEVRHKTVTIHTWRHLGMSYEGDDVAEELAEEWFEDPRTQRRVHGKGNTFPSEMPTLVRDVAMASLEGVVLREERYAVRDGAAHHAPFRVRERGYIIHCLQPGKVGIPAVCGAYCDHVVEIEYDDSGRDPRYCHRVVTETDDLCFPTTCAQVVLPRFDAPRESQRVAHVRMTRRTFVNRVDHPMWFRVGVLQFRSTTTHEVHEWSPSQVVRSDSIAAVVDSDHEGECIEAQRYRYWSNDGEEMLSTGELESRSQLARVETLLWSAEVVAQARAQIEAKRDLRRELDEHGFLVDELGVWDAGQTVSYELRAFALAYRWQSLNGEHIALRRDALGLHLVEVVRNNQEIWRYHVHPRTQSVDRITDPRGTLFARRLDPFGATFTVAVVPSNALEVRTRDGLDPESLEASCDDDPTEVVTWHMAPSSAGPSSWVRLRHRVHYGDEESEIIDVRVTLDGFGQPIGMMHVASPSRTVVHALHLRDEHGRIVATTSPITVPSAALRSADISRAWEVATRFQRNESGDIISVVSPNGAMTATRTSPWQSEYWSALDLATVSPWWKRQVDHGNPNWWSDEQRGELRLQSRHPRRIARDDAEVQTGTNRGVTGTATLVRLLTHRVSSRTLLVHLERHERDDTGLLRTPLGVVFRHSSIIKPTTDAFGQGTTVIHLALGYKDFGDSLTDDELHEALLVAIDAGEGVLGVMRSVDALGRTLSTRTIGGTQHWKPVFVRQDQHGALLLSHDDGEREDESPEPFAAIHVDDCGASGTATIGTSTIGWRRNPMSTATTAGSFETVRDASGLPWTVMCNDKPIVRVTRDHNGEVLTREEYGLAIGAVDRGDESFVKTTMVRDGAGNVVSRTEAAGNERRVTRIERDVDTGAPTRVIDESDGDELAIETDASGNVTSIEGVLCCDWGPDGYLKEMRSELPDQPCRLIPSYDERGTLLSVTLTDKSREVRVLWNGDHVLFTERPLVGGSAGSTSIEGLLRVMRITEGIAIVTLERDGSRSVAAMVSDPLDAVTEVVAASGTHLIVHRKGIGSDFMDLGQHDDEHAMCELWRNLGRSVNEFFGGFVHFRDGLWSVPSIELVLGGAPEVGEQVPTAAESSTTLHGHIRAGLPWHRLGRDGEEVIREMGGRAQSWAYHMPSSQRNALR